MWIWSEQLKAMGFSRKSDRYWQCKNRYGLDDNEHLSLFPWSEAPLHGSDQILVEMDTFHVTMLLGIDHVHFYYHERQENEWQPGGYTSPGEIRAHGANPRSLRARADAIAKCLVEALMGSFVPRGKSRY